VHLTVCFFNIFKFRNNYTQKTKNQKKPVKSTAKMILTKTIELFGQNFRNIDFKDLNFEFNVYLGMIQF